MRLGKLQLIIIMSNVNDYDVSNSNLYGHLYGHLYVVCVIKLMSTRMAISYKWLQSLVVFSSLRNMLIFKWNIQLYKIQLYKMRNTYKCGIQVRNTYKLQVTSYKCSHVTSAATPKKITWLKMIKEHDYIFLVEVGYFVCHFRWSGKYAYAYLIRALNRKCDSDFCVDKNGATLQKMFVCIPPYGE